MVESIKRPPKRIRYFRCRTDKCGTSVSFNLDSSVGSGEPLVCPSCGARWFASYDYTRKACCGSVNIKFIKNPGGLAFIQTYHK